MRPTGNQVVAEFFNCSSDILNERKALETILTEGINYCNLGLVGIQSHCYDPIGITSIAVISESHVAIHTYPEARHASLDIFTCSRNTQASLNLLHFLKHKLEPATIRIAEISRGNPIEITKKDWITDLTTCEGFDIRYHVEDEIFKTESSFQSIKIINNENFGRMLFLDDELQIAENDAYIYNESMVNPIAEADIPLGHTAILGGGDGGVLHELLKQDPSRVTLIDIDEQVISACRKHLTAVCHNAFEDERVETVIADVFNFLEPVPRYDAVVYDLTMHPEAYIDIERETYLDELFTKIKSALKPHGVLSAQCCSVYDTETLNLTRNLFEKHFSETSFCEVFIPSYCTPWVFASARQKQATI